MAGILLRRRLAAMEAATTRLLRVVMEVVAAPMAVASTTPAEAAVTTGVAEVEGGITVAAVADAAVEATAGIDHDRWQTGTEKRGRTVASLF